MSYLSENRHQFRIGGAVEHRRAGNKSAGNHGVVGTKMAVRQVSVGFLQVGHVAARLVGGEVICEVPRGEFREVS